ncbi:MAG: YD repeat-containing protein, partial [Halothiobacillaceae bacterium]
GDDPAPPQLTRYQFGNHLGSASLELDDQAQIISYEEYTPYGSTSYQAVRSQTETPKRYRYTGKERDEESGLYYHGARYYAPWLGRWVSCDPKGIIDGTNLYRYSRNNSLRYTDPDGQMPTAAELAKRWQSLGLSVGIAGALPVTGEDIVQGVGNISDKLSGYVLDSQLQESGVIPSLRRLQSNLALTYVKTAVDVGAGIVAGAVDPGFVARTITRMGETSASGVEDIERGNVVLGTSKIVGEVAMAVGLAGGGVLGARALGVPGTYQPPALAATERVLNVGGELEAKPGDIVVNRPGTAQVSLKTIAKDTGATVSAGLAEELPIRTGTISRYEAHNLAPDVIDWSKAAPEANRVVKPGGTFDISVRGGAQIIRDALKEVGIEATVDPNSSNTRVTGVKPTTN